MRGKGSKRIFFHLPSRITPAYAGKSIIHKKSVYSMWDHPRLCGEKIITKREITAPDGSPPPMRGKGIEWL